MINVRNSKSDFTVPLTLNIGQRTHCVSIDLLELCVLSFLCIFKAKYKL